MSPKKLSRRDFLHLSAASGGALVLAACGGESEPVATSTPRPTSTPTAEQAIQLRRQALEADVINGDVLEYALSTDDWTGDYGWVQFRLHEGHVNGDSIYFIRTDASDPDYASENGLVFVPILNSVASTDAYADYYHFNNGQTPVLSNSPADEMYTSLYMVHNVTVNDDSATLDSAESIAAAAEAGQVSIETTEVLVNLPAIEWASGSLAVDADLAETLGSGQLISAPDKANMTVTMKLHKCYPGSRYILTDTSLAPMAPMMSVPASTPTQVYKEVGATDEIWVFANGIPGSGVMGFQPAIFDNRAGDAAWSPFWDHFTVSWTDESNARLLTTSAEIRELIDSGELELFNGVPNSHPMGFVVNCPAPILAINDFEPA